MINTSTHIDEGLSGLLQRITLGHDIKFKDIRPYLLVDEIELRAEVNRLLADAYFINKSEGSVKRAKLFIDRAFQLSGFSECLIDLYEKINIECGNIEEVSNAYKSIGMKYANKNKIAEALNFFNRAQFALVKHKGIDDYKYDFDILDAIHRLAQQFKYSEHTFNEEPNDKIRIAYLLKGMKDVNSVLVKISILLAEYHDKSLFEIKFFTPETAEDISTNISAVEYSKIFKELGYEVIPAPIADDKLQSVLQQAKNIYEFNPHVLVGNAILADLFDYFIMALNPAPINLGILGGPLPVFASPYMTWNISLFYAMQIEAIANSTYIPLEITPPTVMDNISRESLGISANSVVLASAARSAKYQNTEYWESVLKLLAEHPNTYYLAIGIEKNWIRFLEDMIPEELSSRILFTGWRKDFIELLNVADIVLDTYPTGSGVSLMDAMALGKPIVTFEHDYFEMFKQTEASGSEEFVFIPEITVARGDFESFRKLATSLITDVEYRRNVGEKCKKQFMDNSGSPERMVTRFEKTYLHVIKNHLSTISNSKQTTDFEDLLDRSISQYDAGVGQSFPNNMISDEVSNELKKFKINLLEKENYDAWQKAYVEGYNSSMGNHADYFYNKFLVSIGFYDQLSKSQKMIEYAPGNGEFIKNFVELFPEKEYNLIDISEKNLGILRSTFISNRNVKLLLNYPEVYELSNIDLAFSFLLCQSMPRSLWVNHLKSVNKMLSKGGSYIFQFAFHKDGFADDIIPNGISGSNKYKPEEIYKILEDVGFSGCDITSPITLENFNTDVIWYLCKAY